MISVIIPTCDRPSDYLRKAVLSAVEQSLPPLEVIVVDNGVRDADRTGLPDNIVYHRLPPRLGASRARNFGAAMAGGTHLAFLDDDDWWDVDFLQEAHHVLAAENSRCVYGRKDIFSDGAVRPYKCPAHDKLNIATLLHRNPGVGGQNLIIEKALFWHVGGFLEHLRASNDKALAMELLLRGEKIAIAPKAAAIFRDHDGARLKDKKIQRLRFVWRYRKLYGLKGAARRSYRLLSKAAQDRLNVARPPKRQ